MNQLAEIILGLSDALPWPWRLIPAVGVPLTVVLLLGRITALGLLLMEGAISAKRRSSGGTPGPLAHAISDGLDIFGRALGRATLWPVVISLAIAASVSLAAVTDAGWAVEAKAKMIAYEDRILRAGGEVG